MVGLSFSHNTEQTEWEEEGLRDVVKSDFSLELTDVMEGFQAFLHFHPDSITSMWSSGTTHLRTVVWMQLSRMGCIEHALNAGAELATAWCGGVSLLAHLSSPLSRQAGMSRDLWLPECPETAACSLGCNLPLEAVLTGSKNIPFYEAGFLLANTVWRKWQGLHREACPGDNA